MRKSRHTITDTQTTDSLEVTRRLYRGTSEVVKRLDEQKASALTLTDILTPSGEILRCKLKDYCERLIFKDPVGHGRKIEELLWRKAFYDVVSAAKKLRKGNVWRDVEKALLSTHLAVGVGFYHHLILQLQFEYDLDLAGVVDFAYPAHKSCLSEQRGKNIPQKTYSDEIKRCALRIVHRSLVCLGDLERYKLDLDPNWDPMISIRYYKMAIVVDPNIGMPHNQLGTVAGNKNYGLDAVYHYMRCILCLEPFEGAEGNLKRIITVHFSNEKDKLPVQRCIARLFTLLQKWNDNSSNIDYINEDCQNFLIDIENCLHTKKIKPVTVCTKEAHNIEEYLQNCESSPSSELSSDIVFKMIAICLMSISKLQTKESRLIQGVMALILSLLSQIIQVTIDRIQEFTMDLPNLSNSSEPKHNENCENSEIIEKNLPNNCATEINNFEKSNTKEKIINGYKLNGKESKPKKNLLSKLRRPRKRMNSSDSDGSDIEGEHLDSSSEELNSDISETEEEEDDDEEDEEEDDVISECDAQSDGKTSTDNIIKDSTLMKIKTNSMANTEENISNGHELQKHNGIEVDSKADNETAGDKTANSPANFSATTSSHNIDLPCGENSEPTEYTAPLKKQNLEPNDFLDIISKEELFCSIKICFDWLKSNPNVLRMVTSSSRILLQRITILINLINIDPEAIINKWERDSTFLVNKEKVLEYAKIIPLQEDIEMKGLNLLQNAHESIDWPILRKFKILKQEEVLLRILKLVDFANYLCTLDEVGMAYDKEKNLYILSDLRINKPENNINDEQSVEEKQINLEHSHGKMMRNMGKLWLKAEVRALESRLKSKLMSPYLVPDHEALAKHTPALKRLVYTKKFIVVIPSIVISALDEMKRTSGRAREATRWLEGQLQKGSRFLRAQRPHESLVLPLIKGPRPKDKDAWLFFQIIECCHYLTQQTKVGLSGDTEPPVVTLLTGVTNEERKLSAFSPNGLAKSAGVNLEHIESFHSKWKTSSKSHG